MKDIQATVNVRHDVWLSEPDAKIVAIEYLGQRFGVPVNRGGYPHIRLDEGQIVAYSPAYHNDMDRHVMIDKPTEDQLMAFKMMERIMVHEELH